MARAIHRKLRFPLVLRRQLSFLVQGLKKKRELALLLFSSSSLFLHGHVLGLYPLLKSFLTPPNSATRPNRNE